jgi:hypothetical protein
MPELLENEVIDLSDSNLKFTVHIKDGSSD